MGTHSLRKGAATYGSRSGLSKDFVNRRGRWRTRKAVVDTYIDNTQPYPDACAAAVLTGPQGPRRYIAKRGMATITRRFLVDEVAPLTKQVLGEEIAETLGCVLLWGASMVPETSFDFAILPGQLRERIIQKYVIAGGNPDFNPIDRETFHVVGDGSHLQLVSITEPIDDNATSHIPMQPSTSSGSELARRQFAALHSEFFSLKRSISDLINEVQRSRNDNQRDLDKFSAILRRHISRPVLHVSDDVGGRQDDTGGGARERSNIRIAKLSKRPKDLFELWHEYELGCGGRKPAKDFTISERGANKFAFSRRKIFWDTVAGLIRAGFTSDVAIDKVYSVYGRQLPVSSILTELRADRKRGGHPALRV
ncbi:hypothetical protein AC1031_016630 [Aphanomyces cochlioides]|nr:hypothetical protein AC1031_016630 [Aphanomyces cochlioides]